MKYVLRLLTMPVFAILTLTQTYTFPTTNTNNTVTGKSAFTSTASVKSTHNYYIDTGATGAYIETSSQPIGSIPARTVLNFNRAKTSTGSSTLRVNGFEAATIKQTRQLSSQNHASQNLSFTGSRPYYDPIATGASGSSQNTTANCDGTKSVTLTSAIDFSNGQGIALYGCGASPSISAPSAVGLIASQITNMPTIGLADDPHAVGATCKGTTATLITRGYHGLTAGQNVTVSGLRYSQYNITATLASVPNEWTFTYPIANCPGNTGTTNDSYGNIVLNAGSTTFTYEIASIDAFNGVTAVSPPVIVRNANTPLSATIANKITWKAVSDATEYAVYGRIAGSLTCIGTAQNPRASGYAPTYIDHGLNLKCPENVPSTPPSSAVHQILITSVVSGGGTTALVLANPASATATGIYVEHDDTAAINAAIYRASNLEFPLGAGGPVVIPPGHYNIQTLLFPYANPRGHGGDMSVRFNGEISPRQPIAFRDTYNYLFSGETGGSSPAGGQEPESSIVPRGNNPVIDVSGSSALKFENFNITYCTGDCIVVETEGSGGSVSIDFNNIDSSTYGYGAAFNCRTAGGAPYDIKFEKGVYVVRGVGGYSMVFDNCGIVRSQDVNFEGGGVLFQSTLGDAGGNIRWTGGISENVETPQFTFDGISGRGGPFSDVIIENLEPADPLDGGDDTLVRSLGVPGGSNTSLEHLFIRDGRIYGNPSHTGADLLMWGYFQDFTAGCASVGTDCSGLAPIEMLNTYSAGMYTDMRGARWAFGASSFNPMQSWVSNIGNNTSGNIWQILNGTTLQTPYSGTGGSILAAFDYQGNSTAQKATAIAEIAGGTAILSGCKYSGQVGGAWAGKFISGTTGACTVTITPGATAPNGWACQASDLTTTADVMKQTSYTTKTATISGTTVSADNITWSCVAF